LILPTDRRESSTRSGVVDSSAAIAEASPTPLATALGTVASTQATVEQRAHRYRQQGSTPTHQAIPPPHQDALPLSRPRLASGSTAPEPVGLLPVMAVRLRV
jgi:hypothetical protein